MVSKKVAIIVFGISLLSFLLNQVGGEKSGSSNTKKTISDRSKPKPSSVIDGEKAGKEEFPYIVAITDTSIQNFSYGAGVIIGSQWILTAHHVYEQGAKYKSPLLIIPKYDNQRSMLMMNKKKYQAAEYFCPKDVDFKKGDIILIKLKEPIPLNQEPYKFQKIQMIEADRQLDHDKPVTVAGWGAINMTKLIWPIGIPTIGEDLMKADLKLRLDWDCYQNFLMFYSAPGKFCTDGQHKDACKGDSGGPVVLRNGNKSKDILVGIVSAGSPLCDNMSFHVNVTHWRRWIDDVMKNPDPSHHCKEIDTL